MRKKFMAGAVILALLMNSPQAKADDIVIFGGEFEDASQSKKVEKSEPKKESPTEENQIEIRESKQIAPEEPPTTQPIEKEESAQIEPEETPPTQPPESDEPEEENWGDTLIFDDLSNPPEQKPLKNDEPAQVTPEEENRGDTLTFDDLNNSPEQKPLKNDKSAQIEPQEPPVTQPLEVEQPFEQPTEISNELQERMQEPVEFIPPPVPVATVEEPQEISRPVKTRKTQPQQELKMLKPRFVKLAVDDTYIYYLDKNAVEWRKMPYSTSEYMADVWIRMIEREAAPLDDDMAAYGADNFKAQIDLAKEQGYQYPPEDIKVLSQQAYVLEHYYLRPKTKQVQFLCELEVFGRPQNTINERAYDAKNWENLVPGSVESTIYDAAIKILGKSKGSERGHMTLIDMIEEYGRISLR